MENHEQNQLMVQVYVEFSLFVRSLCLFSKATKEEVPLIGQLADLIHNFGTMDWNSDFGQRELTRYIDYVEEQIDLGSFYRSHYAAFFRDQVASLKKVVRNQCSND